MLPDGAFARQVRIHYSSEQTRREVLFAALVATPAIDTLVLLAWVAATGSRLVAVALVLSLGLRAALWVAANWNPFRMRRFKRFRVESEGRLLFRLASAYALIPLELVAAFLTGQYELALLAYLPRLPLAVVLPTFILGG